MWDQNEDWSFYCKADIIDYNEEKNSFTFENKSVNQQWKFVW